MIGVVAMTLIFLVAAFVAWAHADSVTIGALFILGGAVVKAISDHIGHVQVAAKTAEVEKKQDVIAQKLEANTLLTRAIPAKVVQEVENSVIVKKEG